jgi:hypothetical protein
MLADEFHEKAHPATSFAGKLDANSVPCISRDVILDTIEKGLLEFADREDCQNIKVEKGITNRLCKILSGHKLLYFHHEGVQNEVKGSSASVDLEAIATTDTYFEARLFAREQTLMAIEAKRLPTSPPKKREREYLVGVDKATGGVERFKLGIHGRHSSLCMMLGYVQGGNFDSWRETINGWIDDLSSNGKPEGFWNAKEKLELIATNAATMRCRSEHRRQFEGKTDKMEIVHVWALLTAQNSD